MLKQLIIIGIISGGMSMHVSAQEPSKSELEIGIPSYESDTVFIYQTFVGGGSSQIYYDLYNNSSEIKIISKEIRYLLYQKKDNHWEKIYANDPPVEIKLSPIYPTHYKKPKVEYVPQLYDTLLAHSKTTYEFGIRGEALKFTDSGEGCQEFKIKIERQTKDSANITLEKIIMCCNRIKMHAPVWNAWNGNRNPDRVISLFKEVIEANYKRQNVDFYLECIFDVYLKKQERKNISIFWDTVLDKDNYTFLDYILERNPTPYGIYSISLIVTRWLSCDPILSENVIYNHINSFLYKLGKANKAHLKVYPEIFDNETIKWMIKKVKREDLLDKIKHIKTIR